MKTKLSSNELFIFTTTLHASSRGFTYVIQRGRKLVCSYPITIPPTELCTIFFAVVLLIDPIVKMFNGTFDTTVASFIKTEVHNLNATNNSAATHMHDTSSANLSENTAENSQFCSFLFRP